jgi:hypothetical protein
MAGALISAVSAQEATLGDVRFEQRCPLNQRLKHTQLTTQHSRQQ